MAFNNQSYTGFGKMSGMGQLPQMGMQPMQQGWYQPQQAQQPAGVLLRAVSCIEEVKASPADMSGAPAYFFNPHSRTFYIKQLDTVTGRTCVEEYGRVQPEPEQPDPVTAQLMGRVQKLEEIIAEAQRLGSVRGQKRGAAADE